MILLLLTTPAVAASAAVLRAEYRWNTHQGVAIAVVGQDGSGDHRIDLIQDYNACGGTSPTYDQWGSSTVTKSPATSDGATGATITIDPFYPTPGAELQAFPWPNRCEYASPGYLPTTITVTIYLDDVQVSSGARDFPVFPGISGDTWQEIATYPIRPRIVWELDQNAAPVKVLLHKYRDDDTTGFGGYFSIYQEPQATPTDPPVMRIHGTTEENSVNVTRDVWLRIVDPPSTAPYETQAAAGDNQDPSGAYLYYIDGQGNQVTSTNGVLQMQSNQDNVAGRLRAYLKTSDHYAGENYRVEASFDPSFGCAVTANGNRCAQTTTFTTWKRVYVERDYMFRAGTLLAGPAGGGSSTPVVIRVADKSPFRGARNNNPIPALFIHAPSFDGSGPRQRYVEYRNVIKTAGKGLNQTIMIDQPLNYTYGDDRTSPVVPSLPDAVGVYTPTTISQLYFPDTSLVEGLFAEAFVDERILDAGTGTPNGNAYIPYYETLANRDLKMNLAKKWCDVCDGGLPRNHQYLAGAKTATAIGAEPTGTMGLTDIDQDGVVIPSSFVFIGELEGGAGSLVLLDRCGSISLPNWIRETVVHELVHGWDVNPPTDGTAGHCTLKSWNSTDLECGMHRINGDPTEDVCDRWDNSFVLHSWVDSASEYRRIRGQFEPMSQRRQQ